MDKNTVDMREFGGVSFHRIPEQFEIDQAWDWFSAVGTDDPSDAEFAEALLDIMQCNDSTDGPEHR